MDPRKKEELVYSPAVGLSQATRDPRQPIAPRLTLPPVGERRPADSGVGAAVNAEKERVNAQNAVFSEMRASPPSPPQLGMNPTGFGQQPPTLDEQAAYARKQKPPAAPPATPAPPVALTRPLAGGEGKEDRFMKRNIGGVDMVREKGTNNFGDAASYGLDLGKIKTAQAPVVQASRPTVMADLAGPVRPGDSLERPIVSALDGAPVSPKTTAFNVGQINQDIRARNEADARNGTWASGGGGLTIQSTGTVIDPDTGAPLATNDPETLRQVEQKTAVLNDVAAKLLKNPEDPSVSPELRAQVVRYAQAKGQQSEQLKKAQDAQMASMRYRTALQAPTDVQNANLALNPEMRKGSKAEQVANAAAATQSADAQMQRDIALEQAKAAANAKMKAGGFEGSPETFVDFANRFAPKNPDGSINLTSFMDMLVKLGMKTPFDGYGSPPPQ